METLSDNAVQILEDRYLLKDSIGNLIETPEQLFKRVAKAVASFEEANKERWEQHFYSLLSDFLFLPNSPTLMNAGCSKGQLSACFVLPVEDGLESIFTTLKNTALIHQSGGGTGFNFSKLRPKGDIVSSTSGTSSGSTRRFSPGRSASTPGRSSRPTTSATRPTWPRPASSTSRPPARPSGASTASARPSAPRSRRRGDTSPSSGWSSRRSPSPTRTTT